MQKLLTINPGENFNFGGHRWTVIDRHFEDGGVLAIATGIICHKPLDEDGNNDWRNSSLRKWLNDEFYGKLLNGTESDIREETDFYQIISDLTADDGMKDYGTANDYIALLSCDLYRKYRDIIPPVDDWYWTLTPWSCHPDYSHSARFVGASGALSDSLAWGGNGGVRPLLRLKSEILVSVENEGNE